MQCRVTPFGLLRPLGKPDPRTALLHQRIDNPQVGLGAMALT